MASLSSTSNSDPPALPARFPWALAGAILILLAIEAIIRLPPRAKVIPYGYGIQEHFAVAHYLAALRPADVGFVGSSMTREGVAAPLVRNQLQQTLGQRLYVANYGASALVADEANAVVNYMIRNNAVPRLLMYEVNPQHLRPSISFRMGRLAIFWGIKDWLADWKQSGKPAFDVLPIVIRQEIGRWWLTLRYRDRFKQWCCEWLGLAKKPTVPMLGNHSVNWKAKTKLSANAGRRRTLLQRWVTGNQQRGGYPKVHNQLVECLEQTLQTCQEYRIPIVLYEMPLSPSLRAQIPPDVFDEFYALMDKLASTYGVPFYRVADLDLEIGDEHFADLSHMNRYGAALLTRALTEKVILPHLTPDLRPNLATLPPSH